MDDEALLADPVMEGTATEAESDEVSFEVAG